MEENPRENWPGLGDGSSGLAGIPGPRRAPVSPWTYSAVPWGFEAPPRPAHSRRHMLLAGGLFLLTVGSTWITWGIAYSIAIMTILLSHEMGHYLMCRRYRVRATLPLFIPMPVVSPFGTMGAVILMRQVGQNRRALFDIGVAGPLAGLVPSLAAAAWGLAHSAVVPLPEAGFPGLRLGDSLLFLILQRLFHPGIGAGEELMLHPIAYAGWAGLFVTALNLLPIGQLDGGHVIYGLLGRKSHYVSWAALAGLALVAVFNPQWWVLVALLLFLIGPRHRPVVDESIPLDRGRVILGLAALAVFFLSFTPRPFLMP